MQVQQLRQQLAQAEAAALGQQQAAAAAAAAQQAAEQDKARATAELASVRSTIPMGCPLTDSVYACIHWSGDTAEHGHLCHTVVGLCAGKIVCLCLTHVHTTSRFLQVHGGAASRAEHMHLLALGGGFSPIMTF